MGFCSCRGQHWPSAGCILQKLDPCSLVCTAVTCSKLLQEAPKYIREVVLQCRGQQTLEGFNYWLQQCSRSLTTRLNLTQCSFVGAFAPIGFSAIVSRLPHPHLHQLHLQLLELRLEPATGLPGSLQGCPGLTALHLRDCQVHNTPTAFAAITALPTLQHLEVPRTRDQRGVFLYGSPLQQPLGLTSLSLELRDEQGRHGGHLAQAATQAHHGDQGLEDLLEFVSL
jgi:hypothetical protein